MSGSIKFPRKPPIKIRESRFTFPNMLSMLSFFISVIALGVVVCIALGVVVLPSPDRQETGVTPTLQATSTSGSAASPTATPIPVVRIVAWQTYQFTQPISLILEVENIDPKELTVELLDRNGRPLPDESSSSSPGSTAASSSDDSNLIIFEGDTITIPAERLVGRFTVRARRYDQDLATLPIEVQPPVLPPLAELLDIQPPLKLEGEGKYILLPDESTISVRDQSKPWTLETDQDGFSIEGKTIKLTAKQVPPTLTLRITMTDVYSDTGTPYVYSGELPLVAFSPFSGGQGSLTAYNIEACEEEPKEGQKNNQIVDDITGITDGIFQILNVCQNDRLIMLIARADGISLEGNKWYNFEKIENTVQVTFGEMTKNIPPVNDKLVNKSIFFLYQKGDGTKQIVMFGLLPQSQTQ